MSVSESKSQALSENPPPLPDKTDVLIVGAGPVGLSLAFQLALAGIDALVVERRDTPSLHPKANGVFSRTMEAFRQWGISEETARRSLPRAQCLGFVWMTRMTGLELGRVMFADSEQELWDEYAHHSPETPLFIPQDKIEHLLAEEIGRRQSVDIRYGIRAAALDQDEDGVTATLETDSGQHTIRARYIVGADGARSTVRDLLNITEEASTNPWGESLNIYFESEEFEQLRAGRPYQLWWALNADVRGAFYPVAHKNRWIFAPEAGADASYYDAERCTDLIRKGAGADVAVNIISVAPWRHEVAIAESWRTGRAFLAGDAAHRFPPHGGYGMNSGIQDAQNLGWKLIAVLRGKAADTLLDSYEAERKPVALGNAAQTVKNTEAIKETGWFMPNPAELALIETPEGQPIRDRIAAAVPNQRASVFSHGLQFGTIYRSDAVLSDGTTPPESTLVDYIESASPGVRAPHLVIEDEQGQRLSLLDLFRLDTLVLLTGRDDRVWREAAGQNGGIPVFSIDDSGANYSSADFRSLYEIDRDGAVLVRPDGYVAWRAKAAPKDAVGALRNALEAILGRSANDALTSVMTER